MLPDALSRTPHPRLSLAVAAGLALLVTGGVLAAADALAATGTGLLGIRVGFVGFVCFVFGAAGYVALGVFATHPDS